MRPCVGVVSALELDTALFVPHLGEREGLALSARAPVVWLDSWPMPLGDTLALWCPHSIPLVIVLVLAACTQPRPLNQRWLIASFVVCVVCCADLAPFYELRPRFTERDRRILPN